MDCNLGSVYLVFTRLCESHYIFEEMFSLDIIRLRYNRPRYKDGP